MKKLFSRFKYHGILFITGFFLGFCISNRASIKKLESVDFWGIKISFFDQDDTYSWQNLQNLENADGFLKEIDQLIKYGRSIPTEYPGEMRSINIYSTPQMKELRNRTIILMESIGVQNTTLYKETMNIKDIDSDIGENDLFPAKLSFIDHHVAALSTLKKLIEKAKKQKKVF